MRLLRGIGEGAGRMGDMRERLLGWKGTIDRESSGIRARLCLN